MFARRATFFLLLLLPACGLDESDGPRTLSPAPDFPSLGSGGAPSLGAGGGSAVPGSGGSASASGGSSAPGAGGGAAVGSGGASAPGAGGAFDGAGGAFGIGGSDNGSGGTAATGCEGITPVCTPYADVCHPQDGVIVGCDECGSYVDKEEAVICQRAITTDREADLLCVVRGKSEVECVGPNGWPPAFLTTISEDTALLALVDDGSLYWNEGSTLDPHCELTVAGGVRCSGIEMATKFLELESRSDCTKVVVNDQPQPGACALCSGELLCTSSLLEESVANVRDFDSADGLPIWVAADGVYRKFTDTVLLAGDYAKLSAMDSLQFCAISSAGILDCAWTEDGEIWESTSLQDTPVVDVVVNDGHYASVLKSDGSVVGLNFTTSEELFNIPGPFAEIQGSVSVTCGRSALGEVECWDLQGEPLLPEFL